MKACFTIRPILTDPAYRRGIFLTLLFLVLVPFHRVHATNFDSQPVTAGTSWKAITSTPLAASERRHKIGLLLDYVRKEGPTWAPGLPRALRDPAGWALSGLHNMEDDFGLTSPPDIGAGSDAENTFAAIMQPVSSLVQPPRPEEAQALWFSPGYHHKGILPIHDTLILGIGMREGFFGNRLRAEMRPYYGQNWLSKNGYWGSALSFEFRAKLGPIKAGRIAINYSNGDTALMDSGHGLDLHSELRFDDHLSLQAGVRENEQTMLGNYVLLRWRLFEN